MNIHAMTLPRGRKRFSMRRNRRDSRDYAGSFDLAIRALLGVTFALAAGLYFKNAFAHLRESAIAHSHTVLVAQGLSIFAIGMYAMLIACLYAIRLRPINKFAGPIPAATAVLGGFLVSGLLFLAPRSNLPAGVMLFAAALVLTGNLFAVIALSHLGRSFSILPEGRKLVTTGPYRFVRHPLYVAEAVATLGAMIGFLSPAAMALVAAQFLLQLGRIHYEEKVLRASFPQYAGYSRRTARLIPGIY